MSLELKNCIKEAFDPAMKSYIESDDYKSAYLEFDKMYSEFYNKLPEAMRKNFIALLNARGNLESGLASEAYYRGVLDGLELKTNVK